MKNGRKARTYGAVAAVVLCAFGFYLAVTSPTVDDRPSVASNGISLTATSPSLEFCASPQNRPVTWYAQMDYLTSNPVVVIDGEPGYTKIDRTVEGTGGYPIVVRYFAGPQGDDACMFGLVRTINHPEWDAESLRYLKEGVAFAPRDDERCYSYMPPTLEVDDKTQKVHATLRCDVLKPNFHG